ncbi:hypothetical protein AB0D47_20055 [Streptomyces sp. NPDC048376]|uniref:hypothetical protein n=1 Tax=Streptomyces sp. NPDC048376 TaxID=3154926 RepID=UPI00341813E3
MTLADRQSAALAGLTRRQPPTRDPYPGETRPSGDMPVCWREALAWLDARDRAEGRGQR